MHTRRSPRNQQVLWNALGQEGVTPAPAPRTPLEIAEAALAQAKAKHFGLRTIRQLERDVARARMQQARKGASYGMDHDQPAASSRDATHPRMSEGARATWTPSIDAEITQIMGERELSWLDLAEQRGTIEREAIERLYVRGIYSSPYQEAINSVPY